MMKIAFIHSDRKVGTGAHYINDLISTKCKGLGVITKNFYPHFALSDAPSQLIGIKNILFFYSLLERRDEILKYDIIQGTTYTPLAFLHFSKPVLSHFGSSTQGFLDAVPQSHELESGEAKVLYRMKREGVISELNIQTRQPLRDIASIEKYAAQRVDGAIATSQIVKENIRDMGVGDGRIAVVHNAIEDYWFENNWEKNGDAHCSANIPHLVFLGRLGNDAFTYKLKGLDRYVALCWRMPELHKTVVAMSRNGKLEKWLRGLPLSHIYFNVKKDKIPSILRPLNGNGILFITSRYEGFSLSLAEGMSQGLVPVAYPVGVVPEVIDGTNGIIVHSIDEAWKAIRMLAADHELRRAMANRARDTAIRKFHSLLFVKRMTSIYERVIADYHEKRQINKLNAE